MKKRTACIGAILSLIPLGQPLLIKPAVVLSSIGLIISLSEKASARDSLFYLGRAIKKAEKGDNYGAISDFTKVIEMEPKAANAYHWRGLEKLNINDYYGAISDFNKTLQITPNDEGVIASRGFAKFYLHDRKGACSDWRKAYSLGFEKITSTLRKIC